MRVIVPYIIWTVLYAITSGEMIKIPEYLLTTKANGALYYIFVYVQFVIITPLLGKLALSKFRWLGWIVSPISIFLFKYFPVILNFQWNDWVSMTWNVLCLGWVTFYYLGLCLGNAIIQKDFSVKVVSELYLGSLLIQILEGYWLNKLGMGNFGSQLKISNLLTSSMFLVLAFLYLKDDAVTYKPKILIMLGDCSFGIYLCHIMVMKVLNHIPGYVLLDYGANTFVVLLLSFTCVVFTRKIVGEKIGRWLGFI